MEIDKWDGTYWRVSGIFNGYDIQVCEHPEDKWVIGFKLAMDKSENPYLTMTKIGVWETLRRIKPGIYELMKMAHKLNHKANFFVRGEDKRRFMVWKRFFTRDVVAIALKR